MDILFLLSEEERDIFPKGLLIQDIVLRTDKNILESVLAKNPKHVFITRGYVDTHGEDVILKALKTINILTEASIKYLVYEGNVDKIIQYMTSIGCGNFYKTKVNQITLTRLDTMLAHKYIEPVEVETDASKVGRVKTIVSEISSLSNDLLGEYIKNNKLKIIDSLRSFISTQEALESSEKEIENLKRIVSLIERKLSSTVFENNSLKNSNDVLLNELRELRRDVIKKKDVIEDYNESIIHNRSIDYPIIKANQRGPIILYFKEIEDIGFREFYEAINYTLTDIYKLYTKSVVLERSGRHFYDPYTEDGYVLATKSSKISHIIDNDKLVRYGNPTSLIELLLSPENKIEVLMVFDRTGTENVLIDSDRIIPFYLGNTREVIKTLDITDISFISPEEGKWKDIKPLLRRVKPSKDSLLSYKVHCSRHTLTDFIIKLVEGELV